MLTVIDAAALAAGRFADDPRQPPPRSAPGPTPRSSTTTRLEEVFGDQLACADLVILNKTDLVAPEVLARLTAEIAARLRPGVRIVAAHDGKVAPGVALGLDAAAEDDLAARPSIHELEGEHDHDDFDSFVVTLDAVADAGEGLHDRLAAAIRAHDILRVKGFVAFPGRDRRQIVQAVGDRVQHYFDRPWETGEERATRLVVIGKKGLDRAAIATAMRGIDLMRHWPRAQRAKLPIRSWPP